MTQYSFNVNGQSGRGQADLSNNWDQTYSYDIYDNLSKSVISGRTGTTWTPGYNAANNRCNVCSYNGRGDVSGDGFSTYGFDGYEKLFSTGATSYSACNLSGSGRCIVYDAFGRMVEYSNNGSWAEVWYTQAGTATMTGSSIAWGKFPAPMGSTALVQGNVTSYYYLHPDWLGSSRLISTPNNSINPWLSDASFAPYGETIALYGTNTPWNSFAGTTEEFDSGVLWDTPNRELNASQGRWLSPDPAGAGWNQYAYVNNSPLNATDPLGLFTDAVTPQGDDGCIETSQCQFYYVNGQEVSASTASSLIAGTYVNFGSTPYIGSNTANNGQSYAYQLYASDEGSGYAYPGLSYGTATYELGLPTDAGAADNGPAPQTPSQCTTTILNAVNNQFGTNATSANVINTFSNGQGTGGQATNLQILLTGLSAAQFNSIQPGRYPGSPLTWLTGYGSTLHVTGQTFLDPTASFQNSNIGGLTSVSFTAHIDTSFAYNPIGALIHLIRDVLHIGGPRKPC